MYVIADKRCLDYSAPGHPERPSRVEDTLKRLRLQDELEIEWASPVPVADELLELGHTADYLARLRNPAREFDGDTPAYAGIFDHARRAVGGTIKAQEAALQGRRAFSLLRPPGHHATSDRAMGFCYLSSVGLSALHAAVNLDKRVAVFDFDVHHGNGTESLLLDRRDLAFFSVHQHPCYPGTGATDSGNNCFNYPVPPRTPRNEYRKMLESVLRDLKRWKPDLIAVSAGFDAYVHDPLAQELLEVEDFRWLGEKLADLGVPFYSSLEGGYSSRLPDLIMAWLTGIDD